ncbi:MAG: hypothetical protein QFC78_10365 [Pseudomonadota bacterium]|nr:hypothetical protein [Pseudomonadota bacterium]
MTTIRDWRRSSRGRAFPARAYAATLRSNRSLGDPGYAATPVVDGWLKQVFG